MADNVDIPQRTFHFATRIVKLIFELQQTPVGKVLGNQTLRSGTSIGANVEEAQNCGTRKEFIHTMTIALKEARETYYWLRLIVESALVSGGRMRLLLQENEEIIKILIAIIKRSKRKYQ